MTRNVTFAPGEFYHLYNRGTEKRKIFLNRQDYERFLSLLYLANGMARVDIKRQGSTLSELLTQDRDEKLVDICAYCLMPNHFHLIVRETKDYGISKFMQKLITGYTMYFNKAHERNGALLQGKFKSEHANSDRYLNYLIAYLHLNPIKLFDPTWKEHGIKDQERAEKFLDDYVYSSFLDYSGYDRLEKSILSLDALPAYTSIPKDFRSSITEWFDGQGSTLSMQQS
ncbi:MAG: transposase [Candidatus Zambryskibacteria bacterium]|nr:transposase [Candidatus Zambryskibacteria bacterium]